MVSVGCPLDCGPLSTKHLRLLRVDKRPSASKGDHPAYSATTEETGFSHFASRNDLALLNGWGAESHAPPPDASRAKRSDSTRASASN